MSEQVIVKTCRVIKNVTVDAKVEAEFPKLFRYRRVTPEDRARELESACAEFEVFIRDHRSQDWLELSVVRVKQDVCSHCGNQWEPMDDDGKTLCGHCGAELEATK